MLVILLIISAAVLITLVACTRTAMIRDRGTIASPASTAQAATVGSEPAPHRPNVAFWFVGALVVGVGLFVVIAGAMAVADASDSPVAFGVEGAEALADATSTFTWGVVIVTNGAYVWRGAWPRGARDRIGRVVIIVGYLLIGVAMSEAIHTGVDLWAAEQPGEHQDVLVEAIVNFIAWGVPGALLVYLGTRLAGEDVILTTGVSADF